MQCFCHTCHLGEEHAELNKALVSFMIIKFEVDNFKLDLS